MHAEPERVSCQGKPGPVLGQRAVCAETAVAADASPAPQRTKDDFCWLVISCPTFLLCHGEMWEKNAQFSQFESKQGE